MIRKDRANLVYAGEIGLWVGLFLLLPKAPHIAVGLGLVVWGLTMWMLALVTEES